LTGGWGDRLVGQWTDGADLCQGWVWLNRSLKPCSQLFFQPPFAPLWVAKEKIFRK
jgi:hypothetical protein